MVNSAALEETTINPGYCTRLKLAGGGERWCFCHEDCEIKALWVGPHTEQINAGASSSTQADGDQEEHHEEECKEEKVKQEKGKKRRAEKEKPQEERHKEAKRWYLNSYPGIFCNIPW